MAVQKIKFNRVLSGGDSFTLKFDKAANAKMRGLRGMFTSSNGEASISLFRDSNNNGVLDSSDRHIKTRTTEDGKRLFFNGLQRKGTYFLEASAEEGTKVSFRGAIKNLFTTKIIYRDRDVLIPSTGITRDAPSSAISTVRVIPNVPNVIDVPTVPVSTDQSTPIDPVVPVVTVPETELPIIPAAPATISVVISERESLDAVFDNTAGLYRIEDEQGTVRDPLTGNLMSPTDVGYKEAALRRSTVEGDGLSWGFDSTDDIVSLLKADGQYANFLIANGNVDSALSGNSDVYFEYTQANPLGFDHVKRPAAGKFAWEDLSPGANGIGSDKDYNDAMYKVSIKAG